MYALIYCTGVFLSGLEILIFFFDLAMNHSILPGESRYNPVGYSPWGHKVGHD